jgi:hypothetical protein
VITGDAAEISSLITAEMSDYSARSNYGAIPMATFVATLRAKSETASDQHFVFSGTETPDEVFAKIAKLDRHGGVESRMSDYKVYTITFSRDLASEPPNRDRWDIFGESDKAEESCRPE